MATETLRPNAAGVLSQHTVNGATPGYACVDEVSSDSDTTYISCSTNGAAKTIRDLYNLPIPINIESVDTINSVTVHFLSRYSGTGVIQQVSPVIRENSVNTDGTAINLTTSYVDRSQAWTTRPTGGAWTYDDILALQIGVKSYVSKKNIVARTTQVYVVIDYTANPSASVSASPSASASASPSASESASGSNTPSASPSASISSSPSASESASPSASPSASISSSPSASPSASVSASPSVPARADYSMGAYDTLPTDAADLDILYTAQNVTDVETSDNVRVAQSAFQAFSIHLYKDDVGSATSMTFNWEGQAVYPPAAAGVYLQIYNQNSLTWEALVSDTNASANTDFTLIATVSDLTNYKDGSNFVACRIYQNLR